jgi:putative hydrolase of the HAD superfamily
MPVAAVGFDVYGVMTPLPFGDLEAVATADGAPDGAVTAKFATPMWLEDVQRGRVSLEHFVTGLVQEVKLEHGVHLNPEFVIERLEASTHAIPEMVALVRAVGRQCRVGLLTNNLRDSPLWAPGLDESLFDVIVDASSGVRKPAPDAYAQLCRGFGREPSEVAFVDDSERNLEPARALGLATVLYTDPAQCRRELSALGVTVAR